jgi:2-keto-3-deoxy-L-rhamnonate aldolase RhmA
MRSNPVRKKILAGEHAFGVMAFEFFTPGLPATLAAAGAEFVIFDMEHSGAGIDVMKVQFAAARGAGIVPLVRVPGIAYHLIAPLLDAGAFGIVAPMLETVEQAQVLADACRYRPLGKRGLAFRVAHDDYGTTDVPAAMAAANERTQVIALVESETGIANIEGIMAVPGIDVGWLGHYDLTDSMGIPGRFDDPRFTAAAKKLAAACATNGKAAGILDNNMDFVRRLMGYGYRMIGIGTDIGLMQAAMRFRFDELAKSGV